MNERWEQREQQYNNRACNAMFAVMRGGVREEGLVDDLESAVGYCIDAVDQCPQGSARRSIFADGFRIEGSVADHSDPAFFSHWQRP